MRDDETLVATFEMATFVARDVKTKTDMAEVMAMLMTYDAVAGLTGH